MAKWDEMPWLLKQAFCRRLEADGFTRDICVLVGCLAPAIAAAIMFLAWGIGPLLQTSESSVSVARAALLLLALLAGAHCCRMAVRYRRWRQPAADDSIRRLFALVLVDAAAADYVHALLDGNEFPRGVDCAVCEFLAETHRSALPVFKPGAVSIWTLWDWHLGIPYTDASNHSSGSVDAGKGTVGPNLQ